MTDTSKLNKLVDIWKGRLLDAQMGHYIQSEKMGCRANWIGGAIIVFTVGITAFSLFEVPDKYDELGRWGLAGASGLVTILSAIQTFYKPGEKAEVHRAQAARYGAMKRKLEMAHGEDVDGLWDLRTTIRNVEKEWEGVALDSPLTKFAVIKEVESKKKILAEIKEKGIDRKAEKALKKLCTDTNELPL
ncbi:SLATT domain-containing protein [Desulfovibrio sp. JC022]|uniref:SLATT domain-containing protein n=1 Tax=Desulfovibrio sp. JC022 TaxID=2593642 RepID=UPI0013D798FB|nr:SLATT domain-containing protein [Desulfovibrio sp. JC022]